ncbi:BhlA/UviB family holin-like peptide [Paenibacillus larvae]
MEIMEVIQRYGTDSIFMILFIWLFFNSRKESQIREEQSRTEAREREERLYQMLEEFGQKYDIVIERLDKVDHTLKKIKEK